MQYWLMKSEPTTFSIDDLAEEGKDHWDGVRNYQARNFMRQMAVGDRVFFYHSNCTPPGIVGTMDVVRLAYPDHTAFDKKSSYYDKSSTKENPRWFMVDVKFREKYPELISLESLKDCPQLEGLPLLRRGNRLSVMPVSEAHWKFISKKMRGKS